MDAHQEADQIETDASQIIRQYVTETYGDKCLVMTDITGFMLLAAADTIDRLTRERDQALAEIQVLLKRRPDCDD